MSHKTGDGILRGPLRLSIQGPICPPAPRLNGADGQENKDPCGFRRRRSSGSNTRRRGTNARVPESPATLSFLREERHRPQTEPVRDAQMVVTMFEFLQQNAPTTMKWEWCRTHPGVAEGAAVCGPQD